jgi:hypothetical protein
LAHSISTTRSIPPSRSTDARRPRVAWLAAWLVCAAGLFAPAAEAARETLQLFVAEPYLELHIGPGRRYPVTQVVARGESVDVLYRRTEWFRVRTERGVEGWVAERDLSLATLADGSPFKFDFGDRAGFMSHHWEGGVTMGDLGGATLISAYASRSLTNQLAVELTASQFLGSASNGYLADIGLAHVFAPEWRLSPFVSIGTGIITVQPKTTLVQQQDRTDPSAFVGAGLRWYWTRRFFVRGEYRTHKVFTSRNANEEIDEWKLGLAFFY